MARCAECLQSTRACDACAETNAQSAWERYCLSGHKPLYLPDRPDVVYAEAWRGWRDWVLWTIAEPRLRAAFEVAAMSGGSWDGPSGGG